ncbi:MAG TPA: LuxR C-terminal-related transcriptional regulator, partial [Longimicrobiales bacterium]|nr:LuxR C-terminal-related transcriptional regulator [Longimicrobiales bacterium]
LRRKLSAELISSLIEEVYEGVLDETRWESAAERLRSATGALSSVLSWENSRHVFFGAFAQPYVPRDLEELYVRELYPLDVPRNVARTRPEGSWVSTEETELHARFRRSALEGPLYRVIGIDRIEGIPVWNREGLYVTMSLNFHRSAPLLAPDEIRALGALGGHVARAARLQDELWRRGATLGALLTLVDRVTGGVVLVDREGRVVHANPEAVRLFAEGDGVLRSEGRLVAVDARTAPMLRGAIARASAESSDGPATGDLLLLPRPPGRRPLEVAITPLPVDSLSERSAFRPLLANLGHPAAAILISDAERIHDRFAHAIGKLYELTPAEAAIATAIAQGARVSSIALERGVSEQTVRSQLKSVFEKTGTSSQGELAALLAASLQRAVLGTVP